MAELAFPVAATLVVALIGIPAATLVAKLWLVAQRRWAPGIRDAGSGARYLLIIAPTAGPALWLVSAAIHHAEAEHAALACLFDHVSEGVCSEPLLIAAAVALALGSTFAWRRHVAAAAIRVRHPAHDAVARRRLKDICAGHRTLRAVTARVRLVEGDDICTIGLLVPRIEVGVEVCDRLDDQALTAALLHEEEHLRGMDPLRFVIAAACQAVNPAAFLLSGELARWRAGREAVCDAAAVHRGADPVALAEALIAAARPSPSRQPAPAVAHLGGALALALLRVRVSLLMGYASCPPRRPSANITVQLAALALIACCALPHYFGEHMLIDLHHAAERPFRATN